MGLLGRESRKCCSNGVPCCKDCANVAVFLPHMRYVDSIRRGNDESPRQINCLYMLMGAVSLPFNLGRIIFYLCLSFPLLLLVKSLCTRVPTMNIFRSSLEVFYYLTCLKTKYLVFFFLLYFLLVSSSQALCFIFTITFIVLSGYFAFGVLLFALL